MRRKSSLYRRGNTHQKSEKRCYFVIQKEKTKNKSKQIGKKHSVGLENTELSCPDFSATKTFLIKHKHAVRLRPPSLSAESRADSVGRETRCGARPPEFRGGDSSHNNRTRAQAGWQCHTHSVNYQVGTRRGAPGRRHQPRRAKQEEPPAQEVAPTLERPLPGLQGPGRPPTPGTLPPLAEVSLQRRPLCAGGWGAERKSTDARGRCPEPRPGPWGLRSGSRVGAEPRRRWGARGGRGVAEPLSRKPWKSCSASHEEQPALPRPPRASAAAGIGAHSPRPGRPGPRYPARSAPSSVCPS